MGNPASKWRGHPIYWNGKDWIYTDTAEKVSENPDRLCGHCKASNRQDGHDACLGELPGVANACCGHGVKKKAYIQFNNKVIIQGFNLSNDD